MHFDDNLGTVGDGDVSGNRTGKRRKKDKLNVIPYFKTADWKTSIGAAALAK